MHKKEKLEKRVIQSAKACAKKFSKNVEDKSIMVKYCCEKIKTIMDLEEVPHDGWLQSIQNAEDTNTKFFYNKNTEETGIAQLDGNFEVEDLNKEVRHLYGVICKINKLSLWINFIRGFENIWNSANMQSFCNFHTKEKSCSFCLLRSLYNRLNHRGIK